MTDRLDALTVREDKNGKAWWTKIGSAFQSKDGASWIVRLDAVPASTDGQYAIHLREPRAREDAPQRQTGGGSQGNRQRSFDEPDDDLNDSVPF